MKKIWNVLVHVMHQAGMFNVCKCRMQNERGGMGGGAINPIEIGVMMWQKAFF